MADDNEWDDVVSGVLDPQSQARAAVGAPQGTPDQAAKSLAVGGQLGVPPAIVNADPEGWNKTAKAVADNQAIAANPALARHLTSDPMAAEVSNDDVGPLGNFISTVGSALKYTSPLYWMYRTAPAPVKAGIEAIPEGYEEQNYARAAAANQLGVVGDQSLEAYERDIQAFPRRDGAEAVGAAVGHFLGATASSAQVAAPAAGAGFVVGGPAGALAGATLGFSADVGAATSGTVYRNLSQVRDANGNPISETTKQTAAVAAGIASAGLAQVGGKVAGGLIGEAVTRALVQPAAHFAIRQGIARLAASGLEGGALNLGMQLASSVSENLAKQYQGNIPTVFNSPQERSEFLKNAVDAAVQGAALFGALHLPTVLGGKLLEGPARANAEGMDQAFAAGDATKTKERSPDMAAAAARQATGDATVSLPAEVAAQHPEITGLPGVGEQMELGLGTGGDVTVPAADFVGRVPSETYGKVRDDVAQGSVPSVNEVAEAPESNRLHVDMAPELGDNWLKVTKEGVDGNLLLQKKGDALVVDAAHVAEDQRGKGHAADLYRAAIDHAFDNGLKFRSDESVSPDAQRVYEGLRRRGYTVEESEGNTGEPGQSRQAKSRSGYVYEVTGRPAKAPSSPRWTGLGEQLALTLDRQREAMWLDPLFKDGKSLGLSEDEFARYSKKLQDTQAAVAKDVFDAAAREEGRAQGSEWRRNEAGVREEVERDLAQRPDLAADQYFRTGRGPDGGKTFPMRLDPDAIDNLFTRDEAAALGIGSPASESLPKGMLSRREGMHPDQLADLFGYASGKEMIADMAGLESDRRLSGESPNKQRSRLVDEETARRMEAKYGSLNDNVTMSALDAMMSVKQIDVFASELTHLAERIGERPIARDDIEGFAREAFNDLPAKRAANVESYQRLVGRNGRKAEQALLKGDFAEAFRHKQFQAYNFALAREASAFRKDVKALDRIVDRYTNGKAAPADPEFGDQIQKILWDVGFDIKRSNTDKAMLAQKEEISAFAARMSNEQGLDIPVYDHLSIPDINGKIKQFKDFTAQEVRAMAETVKSLDYIGRAIKNVETHLGKVEFKRVVDEMRTSVGLLPERRLSREPGLIDKLKRTALEFDAMSTQVEEMFLSMDRLNEQGPFHRYVEMPVQAAKVREIDLQDMVGKEMRDIAKPHPGADDLIPNLRLIDWRTGEPMEIRRKNMMMMAAYAGSEQGWAKLTQEYAHPETGLKYRFDPDDVQKLFDDNMRKEDWEYVDKVHRTFDKLYPHAVEMYRKLNGIAPNSAVAREQVTLHGTYKGGYVPLSADPFWRGVATKRAGVFDGGYFRSLPKNSYTKDITNVGYPLNLSFSRIPKVMEQTIHDVAWRPALRDINRIMDDRGLRQAVHDHYGPEYQGYIDRWMDRLANGGQISDESHSALDNVMRATRQRYLSTMMAYRIATLAKHNAGLMLNTVGELGMKDFVTRYGKAVGYLYGDPRRWNERMGEIVNLSGEIRARWHNSDRDQQEMMARALEKRGPLSVVQRKLLEGGYNIFATTERLSVAPLFHAVYTHQIEQGVEPATAAFVADKAIRKAHGSNSYVDTPDIMNGSEARKALTIAFGVFSHQYNRIRRIPGLYGEAGRALANGETMDAFNKFNHAVMMTTYYVALMGAVEEIGRNQKEEGSFLHRMTVGAVKQLFNTIPLLRSASDLLSDAATGFKAKRLPPTMGEAPLVQMLDVGAHVGHDLFVKPDKNAVRDVTTAVGFAVGLPGARQLGLSMQFLNDLDKHKQQAHNPVEFARGVAFGKSEPGK